MFLTIYIILIYTGTSECDSKFKIQLRQYYLKQVYHLTILYDEFNINLLTCQFHGKIRVRVTNICRKTVTEKYVSKVVVEVPTEPKILKIYLNWSRKIIISLFIIPWILNKKNNGQDLIDW